MVLLSAITYNPLPADFTDNAFDRTVAYFIEVFLRLSYVYPTATFCGDAYCELRWTRWVLDSSLWFINLITIGEEELLVDTVYFESVRVRVYRPTTNSTQLPAVVFIHGGGYVMGSVEGFDSIARRIASSTHTVVVSVDYRLAPEHVFPAAVDDAETAVVYLLTRGYVPLGVDRSRVAVMGDSAGGGLVAAVTQRLRKRSDLPRLKVVWSAVDAACTGPEELERNRLARLENAATASRIKVIKVVWSAVDAACTGPEELERNRLARLENAATASRIKVIKVMHRAKLAFDQWFAR
ncbi:Arylacetamide deacetylase-like 4 [Toxocara canis]|uniref:Arylacetamide deacetylase-like 4 n=1 Tax=Toxocara canis TaxID=6265 RepID=A0A0B2VUG2_TOXCA|nr:Arylacetamide deacetylase-like 4 [Toxocara canis]